jgi:hypothetical protein
MKIGDRVKVISIHEHDEELLQVGSIAEIIDFDKYFTGIQTDIIIVRFDKEPFGILMNGTSGTVFGYPMYPYQLEVIKEAPIEETNGYEE